MPNLLEGPQKIVNCNPGLFQNTAQCSDCHLIMHGDNAADRAALQRPLHHNMAAPLAHFSETKMFQGADDFPSGKMW